MEMEGVVSNERPDNYRRMLAAVERIEEVLVAGEDQPRRICVARFPAIFSGEERVRIPMESFDLAGIEAKEGMHFMAWANLAAEKPEDVMPVDFENVEPLTEEEIAEFERAGL